MWSRKQLVGLRVAHNVVNPRMLKLEVAKEILAELFDISVDRHLLEKNSNHCDDARLFRNAHIIRYDIILLCSG